MQTNKDIQGLSDDDIDAACQEITRQEYPQAMEYDRAIARAVLSALATRQAAPVASQQGAGDEVGQQADALPQLPEMDSLADVPHALKTPDDWDSDYRSTWQKLQVAERNKMQWRAYALELRAALAAANHRAWCAEVNEDGAKEHLAEVVAQRRTSAAPATLFDRKLVDLEQRGYQVIGRILHKEGQYALFDSSCRWLTQPQYQRLMHEQDGSLFADKPTSAADSEDAARDVLAERQRQIKVEGWTPAHDDAYADGVISAAAACYALHSEPVGNVGDYLRFWPWSNNWWKPKDRRSNLVKAGALILADIERIDRAARNKEAQKG
jgi:hypothetical protein